MIDFRPNYLHRCLFSRATLRHVLLATFAFMISSTSFADSATKGSAADVQIIPMDGGYIEYRVYQDSGGVSALFVIGGKEYDMAYGGSDPGAALELFKSGHRHEFLRYKFKTYPNEANFQAVNSERKLGLMHEMLLDSVITFDGKKTEFEAWHSFMKQKFQQLSSQEKIDAIKRTLNHLSMTSYHGVDLDGIYELLRIAMTPMSHTVQLHYVCEILDEAEARLQWVDEVHAEANQTPFEVLNAAMDSINGEHFYCDPNAKGARTLSQRINSMQLKYDKILAQAIRKENPDASPSNTSPNFITERPALGSLKKVPPAGTQNPIMNCHPARLRQVVDAEIRANARNLSAGVRVWFIENESGCNLSAEMSRGQKKKYLIQAASSTLQFLGRIKIEFDSVDEFVSAFASIGLGISQ